MPCCNSHPISIKEGKRRFKVLEDDGWSKIWKQKYYRGRITDKQRILDEQSKARLASVTLKKELASEFYEVMPSPARR